MNWAAPLTYLIERADLDCVLLAGRYTLLDHASLDDLLPLAPRRGVSIVAGGVFNSGILADPRPARPTTTRRRAEVMARATRLADLCADHGVTLGAAALQFPLAHPVVAAAVVGARSPAEVEENAEALRMPVPAEL